MAWFGDTLTEDLRNQALSAIEHDGATARDVLIALAKVTEFIAEYYLGDQVEEE
jgi:hypothetical protein